MSGQWVVLEHQFDQEADTYSCIIGWQEMVDVQATDAAGVPVFDENGQPVVVQQAIITSTLNYVFAADDERWAGMREDKVAEVQRNLILETLPTAAPEAQTQPPPPETTRLPGVGEPL